MAGYLAALVYFSTSATPPAGTDGILLNLGDIVTGNAPHIWVREVNGACTVQCGSVDQ